MPNKVARVRAVRSSTGLLRGGRMVFGQFQQFLSNTEATELREEETMRAARTLERPADRRRTAAAIAVGALLGPTLLASAWPSAVAAGSATYRNPIAPLIAGDGVVESCADPTTIRDTNHDGRWYLFCTTDPLNDDDRDAGGALRFHLIPILSSADLVHWRYEGDAFQSRPAYARPDAGLWAPEIVYHPETGQYLLYYTVTDTTLPGGGSAIGVATAASPAGPWTHAGAPVVEPHG